MYEKLYAIQQTAIKIYDVLFLAIFFFMITKIFRLSQMIASVNNTLYHFTLFLAIDIIDKFNEIIYEIQSKIMKY